MKSRIVGLFCFFIFAMSGVLLRLMLLTSGWQSQSFLQAANRQSSYTLNVDRSRGMIYDCNLKPLVNTSFYYKAGVVPSPEAGATLLNAVEENQTDALASGITGRTPFLIDVQQPIYSGTITTMPCFNRYNSDPLAVHIIGHLDGDKNGTYGIERAFNEFLSETTGGSLKISFSVDGTARPMQNTLPEVTNNGYGKAEGMVLTIDQQIQEIVERLAPSYIATGAVVVMDVTTGAIRASLSLPEFDPNDVAKDLENPLNPFINRAFAAHSVGSTFKLVVASAALESGYSPSWSHECKSWIDVEGQVFTCTNHAVPKVLDMEEAIATSCNTYFVALAQELTANRLIAFAEQFRFGEATPLAENYYSEPGYLPSLEELLQPAELGNFSFGQGKLSATPIQIAAMVGSIANNGNLVYPYIVEGYTDETGKEIAKRTAHPSQQRVMKVSTANYLQKFMKTVVEEGSGKSAKPKYLGAGGKTASAQTGVMRNGEELVDAWFSGFYPADHPEYIIVIVNEGMESGGKYAAPLFQKIADELYLLKKYRDGR